MSARSHYSQPAWTEVRDGTLERLVAEARPREFFGFRQQLLEACAEVVAQSGGRTIVFVGRSPETLYDLLGALLNRTRRAPRVVLLPFSMRHDLPDAAQELARRAPPWVEGLERHLREAALGPTQIVDSDGVAFVDCVCWGTTFGNLDRLLAVLALRAGHEPRVVLDRVRYVGLTQASLGWTHWRHDEESRGALFFSEGRATVVPISNKLWWYLAACQSKTMDSYERERWAAPPRLPALDEERARAIRLAVELRQFGSARDVRRAFAGMLARRAQKHGRWLGSLVVEVLKSTQLRRGNR